MKGSELANLLTCDLHMPTWKWKELISSFGKKTVALWKHITTDPWLPKMSEQTGAEIKWSFTSYTQLLPQVGEFNKHLPLVTYLLWKMNSFYCMPIGNASGRQMRYAISHSAVYALNSHVESHDYVTMYMAIDSTITNPSRTIGPPTRSSPETNKNLRPSAGSCIRNYWRHTLVKGRHTHRTQTHTQ